MAENFVVKEQLTEAMIDAGAELTQKLLDMGIPITASLWFFDLEICEWRLLLSSPDVPNRGPLTVYEQIQRALDELGPKAAAAPFEAISLLSPSAELVRNLKLKFTTTGPGISRIRFYKNVAYNQFVHDALIYRVA